MQNFNEKNFHAVLIGFNKYEKEERLQNLQFAEKDALDFFNVLIDPDICNYPIENITILMGENTTTSEIEKTLSREVVNERNANDTVLVYYSGHGFFAGESGNVYLATPDITITDILNNPRAGLQMNYLNEDIFFESPAKQVIFILDCCHSGAFYLGTRNDGNNDPRVLVNNRFYDANEGKVVLASSPMGVLSRENDMKQNGVFTSILLDGLRGKAVETIENEQAITFSNLVAYVMNQSPPSQIPQCFGTYGRIILAKPKNIKEHLPHKLSSLLQYQPVGGESQIEIKSLPNPIDEYVEVIENLMAFLGSETENSIVSDKILEAILNSISSEYAFVIQVTDDKSIHSKFFYSLSKKIKDIDKIINDALRRFFFLLSEPKDKILQYKHGFCVALSDGKKANENLIVIPLRLDYPREFLVIHDTNHVMFQKGEVIGRLLISLYVATNEFSSFNATRVHNELLDDLRLNFGYVPKTIYNKRLSLFMDHLHTIDFVFEPIILLGLVNPQIDSWEALARDPLTGKAPFSLFTAAKLWGPQFTKELDLYCLKNAVHNYTHYWNEEHSITKKDQLSVNVYPTTLLSPEYKEELLKITKIQDIIKPRELVLEISEREPLPYPPSHSIHNESISYFEYLLHEYTDELGIIFAIDDFGSGFSSVGRLVRLELDHIKIDREVLQYRSPIRTINYVLKTVKDTHTQHTKVVIEGFDGENNISLAELYYLGARYIQGHLLRRGEYSVRNLEDSVKSLIVDELGKGVRSDITKIISGLSKSETN